MRCLVRLPLLVGPDTSATVGTTETALEFARVLTSYAGKVTDAAGGRAPFQVLVLPYRQVREGLEYALFRRVPTPHIGRVSQAVGRPASHRCRRPGGRPPRRRA